MYQPDHFRVDDLPQLHALMRARPFATLVSSGALGNVADAFNSLLESLQALMTRVSRQIEKTNQTVSLIAASSHRMAEGATTQATEVKEAAIRLTV